MNRTDVIQFLKQFLSDRIRSIPAITVVYVFGSYARGTDRESSDIDLAFHFKDSVYKRNSWESFSVANLIASEIGEMLGRKTDVALLNGSSLEIAYEIVTTGICVYETDPDSRLEYEAALTGQWFDFKPFLRSLRERCLRDL